MFCVISLVISRNLLHIYSLLIYQLYLETGVLELDEIKNIMFETQSTEECVDKLVQTAIDNGGKDNVTVVVLDFEKQSLIDSILDYLK